MEPIISNSRSEVIPISMGEIRVYDQGLFYAYEDDIKKVYRLVDKKIKDGFKHVSCLVYSGVDSSSLYVIGSKYDEDLLQHTEMLQRGEPYLLENKDETYEDKDIRVVDELSLIELRLISLTFPMRFTARTISADSISRGNIGYLLSDKLENYHHVFPHLMFQNTPVSKVILSEVSDFVNSKPKNTTRDVEVRNFGWSPEKIYNKYIIGTEYEDPKDIKAKVLRATREELTAMEKAEKYKH